MPPPPQGGFSHVPVQPRQEPSGPIGQEFVVREGAPIRFGGIEFSFAADRNLLRFHGRGYTADHNRSTRIEIQGKYVFSLTFVPAEERGLRKGAKLTVTWSNPSLPKARTVAVTG